MPIAAKSDYGLCVAICEEQNAAEVDTIAHATSAVPDNPTDLPPIELEALALQQDPCCMILVLIIATCLHSNHVNCHLQSV